jgi:hypothetical protein
VASISKSLKLQRFGSRPICRLRSRGIDALRIQPGHVLPYALRHGVGAPWHLRHCDRRIIETQRSRRSARFQSIPLHRITYCFAAQTKVGALVRERLVLVEVVMSL